VPPDTVIMSPLARTHRAGWGWLLLATVARAYLAFLGSLAACAFLPMLCGLSGAVVQSGSMEPHISAGDVVLSQTSGAGSALPMGRVITFRAPTGSATNAFVLHRLVASNKNGTLVTKGDANASPDSTPLDRRNIKSQARLLIPWMGLPAFWVTSGLFLPLGIWLLLTVVALCIALTEATGQFSSLLTRVQIGSGPAGSCPGRNSHGGSPGRGTAGPGGRGLQRHDLHPGRHLGNHGSSRQSCVHDRALGLHRGHRLRHAARRGGPGRSRRHRRRQ
jgi:signal peptidase I